jgi:hypothetical protein
MRPPPGDHGRPSIAFEHLAERRQVAVRRDPQGSAVGPGGLQPQAATGLRPAPLAEGERPFGAGAIPQAPRPPSHALCGHAVSPTELGRRLPAPLPAIHQGLPLRRRSPALRHGRRLTGRLTQVRPGSRDGYLPAPNATGAAFGAISYPARLLIKGDRVCSRRTMGRALPR